MIMNPEGVFLDMDGTLIETEHFYAEVGEDLVRSIGGVWTEEDSADAYGLPLDAFAHQLQELGVELPTHTLIETVVSRVNNRIEREDVWRPGARQLIDSLEHAGIPYGLVTMSYAETLIPVFAGAPMPKFNTIITGDKVERGKPDPLPYELAAQELGLDPRNCVALEDSGVGLASAKAAGMTTIAVPSECPADSTLFDAWWPDLREQTAQDIIDLYNDLKSVSVRMR